jgi:hypothetical protein
MHPLLIAGDIYMVLSILGLAILIFRIWRFIGRFIVRFATFCQKSYRRLRNRN